MNRILSFFTDHILIDSSSVYLYVYSSKIFEKSEGDTGKLILAVCLFACLVSVPSYFLSFKFSEYLNPALLVASLAGWL